MSKYILEPSVFIKMVQTPLLDYGVQYKRGTVNFPEPINVIQYTLTPGTSVKIGYLDYDNTVKYATQKNEDATMEAYYAKSYESPLRIISLNIGSIEGFGNLVNTFDPNYTYTYILIIVILLLAYYNYDKIKKMLC